MKIIYIEGKTREENKQYIIVKADDKYGIGMLAYFKNSLNGQNVKKLSVKNSQDVTLFYNRLQGLYILHNRLDKWKKTCYTLNVKRKTKSRTIKF